MKHLFSTIAFALFLSINHVAAFNGSGMMEQEQGNAKAQVDKKAGQPNVAKKTQADAKNKQKAPGKPNVNTNDAQLMTEEANADRQGYRDRASGGQQQQEVDPLHQDADTATVDTTTASIDVATTTLNANADKDEESRGAGNMKMWLIVDVAIIVIIYFALRKKPVNNKR